MKPGRGFFSEGAIMTGTIAGSIGLNWIAAKMALQNGEHPDSAVSRLVVMPRGIYPRYNYGYFSAAPERARVNAELVDPSVAIPRV